MRYVQVCMVTTVKPVYSDHPWDPKRVAVVIDYCSLIGRKNLDVNKDIAKEDRPSAITLK